MLFAETMAIRWLGIEIPVLRAFPNLILMLVFIGASAGIAQPEKRVGTACNSCPGFCITRAV